ncbi:YIP1 family protein [Halococcus sp. AFM35]|uniref:YIP1 family protein n=1 Tax=Halococcus sp. AFM35 TaxID=3421653 RepID=UPI003EC0158A
MTQWVENPTGGRDRGPIALARAWLEVLVRPRRFFATGVAPGDQAPGLAFVMTVVAIEEATRFALVPGSYPVIAGQRLASALLALLIAVGFIAPLALHLAAAIETLALVPVADERAGVSETVQVIAYASAPCVLAGVPFPALRIVCTLYGAGLLVVGTSEVHGTGLGRAAVAAAVPALFVFGYAFRGIAAATVLLA